MVISEKMPSCSVVEGGKWNFLMIDLRDDLVTGYLMPPMLISNVLDMTYWPARTYLKIIDHKFTVQRDCGNGPLQATLSGDVIILRGCVRQNSGTSGGRENRHGYRRDDVPRRGKERQAARRCKVL